MFKKLFKQVLKYKYYLVSNTLKDNATLNKHTSSITEHIKQFICNPPDNIHDFIQEHQAELLMIHYILIGTYFKLYAPKNLAPELRGLHDRIFNIFNIKRPKQRFSRIATVVCTEFCKGITFFANNTGIDRIPFYHRDTSCGKANETSRDKFAKHLNENEKHFLENCYIERLIYNKVYQHYFYSQDIGHLHELRYIEQLFQDNFPDSSIQVEVKFNEENTYPIALHVTKRTGRNIVVESYTKAWKATIVNCTKFQDIHSFSKTQTFHQESPWIAI